LGNVFINLPAPVPVGDGAGAAVDVSAMGAVKTIVVGGNARATILIEVNNDGVPNASWQAVASFQNGGQLTVRVAARWMRMRVAGYNPYIGGTPTADVGGSDDSPATFASLPVSAGTGVGAPVDVSALGLFKSVQVADSFRGTVIVEVSEDGSTDWAQPFSFQTPGIQSAVIAAKFMRVRRVGVPNVSPGLPVVNVGATNDVSGDGGVAISAGTQSADSGTVLFANSNGISFGMSGSSRVTASMDAVRSILAGTATATGPTVSFANSNGISFGITGQTVTASAAGATQSTAPGAIAAGTQTATSGTIAFVNSNGVTFGMSASSQITASYSQSTNLAAAAAGTQTQTSGTVAFLNSNGVTFGMSNSSQITASYTQSTAPSAFAAGTQIATSGTITFVDSNGVSFGMSGSSQITATVASQTDVTMSQLFPAQFGMISSNLIGQNSLHFHPVVAGLPVTFDRLHFFYSVTNNGASTGTVSMTQMFGVYTLSGSTLSQLSSTSLSISYNFSGAPGATVSGARMLSVGFSGSLSKGMYWIGVVSSSTTSSQNGTFGNLRANANFGDIGYLGSALGAYSSMQVVRGEGFYSATTGALPASVALTEIAGTDAGAHRPPAFALHLSQ
jgi:hypothetical protein